jgi:cytidine deaminase
VALAIAAAQNEDFLEEPISPCGACRQVMLEYEQKAKKPIDVLLYGKNNIYLIKGVKQLLPFSFVSETMGIHI